MAWLEIKDSNGQRLYKDYINDLIIDKIIIRIIEVKKSKNIENV